MHTPVTSPAIAATLATHARTTQIVSWVSGICECRSA